MARPQKPESWLPSLLDLNDPAAARNGLLEHLQTLCDELRGEEGQPRDIAARPRKAGDEPAPNRIGSSSEHNGEGPGRLLGGQGGECASCSHDDINLERNQFGRKSGEPLGLPLGTSVFNHEVAALDVTEVTQSLEEGLLQVGISGQVGRQVADSSAPGRLLGLGRNRTEEPTEEKDDGESEPQPYHLGSGAIVKSCG